MFSDVVSVVQIDIFGDERAEHQYWTSSNEELTQYTKGRTFDYPLNDNQTVQFIPCRIIKSEVTGCIINVRTDGQFEEIEIDFTDNTEYANLNKFEPCLERPGMAPVDFIYEGFLVRCRPNLDEFLEYVADDFDVVIYTSANRMIYEPMYVVLR